MDLYTKYTKYINEYIYIYILSRAGDTGPLARARETHSKKKKPILLSLYLKKIKNQVKMVPINEDAQKQYFIALVAYERLNPFKFH